MHGQIYVLTRQVNITLSFQLVIHACITRYILHELLLASQMLNNKALMALYVYTSNIGLTNVQLKKMNSTLGLVYVYALVNYVKSHPLPCDQVWGFQLTYSLVHYM